MLKLAGSQCGTNALVPSPTMVLRRLDFLKCDAMKYNFLGGFLFHIFNMLEHSLLVWYFHCRHSFQKSQKEAKWSSRLHFTWQALGGRLVTKGIPTWSIRTWARACPSMTPGERTKACPYLTRGARRQLLCRGIWGILNLVVRSFFMPCFLLSC